MKTFQISIKQNIKKKEEKYTRWMDPSLIKKKKSLTRQTTRGI
jgi:hypothetical protein